MMLKNLLIGLPTMLLCLVVQTWFVFWSIQYYAQQAAAAKGAGAPIGIRPLLIAVLIMLLGTIVQITVWGTLFVLLGQIDEMYEAIYHSAVNFSCPGYGDFVVGIPAVTTAGPIREANQARAMARRARIGFKSTRRTHRRVHAKHLPGQRLAGGNRYSVRAKIA